MSDFDPTPVLARLRLGPDSPSVAALTELHTRFVEVIPYENLDIVLGRPPGIDPATSAQRVAAGRGGYCYNLNGVFAATLRALGYAVTLHVGGVQGPHGPAHVDGNHLALTVDVEGQSLLVDVGLSDCLHEPLPLRAGTYRQGPFTVTVRPSQVSPGGWRLDHDPKGSFVGMDFVAAPAALDDFQAMHAFLSTSAESPFVRTVCAARRDAAGVDLIRSLTLLQVRDEVARTVLDRRSDWFAALADLFGLTLADLSDSDKDRLWALAVGQHEAFLAARAARASAQTQTAGSG